jgi:formate hydrogenlyase subunit 3/multisubunit Na+/H+ antiporter MnhD subunit
MFLVLLGLGILVLSGLASLLAHRSPRLATGFGVGGAVAGSLIALAPVLGVLGGWQVEPLRWPWAVPFGEFHIALDALSAWFLLPILLLSAAAAVYGAEYLWPYRERKSLGPPWFFYNVLVASMALVVLARNGVLFLVAWEVMALASFFLVTFEDEKESVRAAGWTYLVATHLGTAFLLAMFVLLGREAGSLDFDAFGKAAIAPALANLLFMLAVIGFGTKAGFMPLHVWLPEAHPAAPSHVSAIMSGVMIKTGIYGLVRVVAVLGAPPAWWGWLLVGIGLTSGIAGVLFALAQRDLKRTLAYSSVENIGIIALGLGLGVVGRSTGSNALLALGFGGAMLHVLNHALFKGLLFLGAGAVAHGTGSRDMDRLGGLLKRMPKTGTAFLVGAAAISALPPFNGFIGEFLIYLGAFKGAVTMPSPSVVPALAVIVGLALIGGLAAVCFTRAFGMVFLGEPRSEAAAHAHEPGLAMRLPMWVLAAGCVLVGLGAPLVWRVVTRAFGIAEEYHALAALPLTWIVVGSVVFLLLIGALALLRRKLLAGRPVGESATWGCGYAQPTARMQYTASSFSQPVSDQFHALLGTRAKFEPPAGYFPRASSLATETPDVCSEKVFGPAFAGIDRALSRLRWLQHGTVQIYVLYIALTLLALLVWKLG